MTKISKGFTLVELIIYLAIFALIVTGFVSFAVSVSNARNKAFAAQEVQANGRDALNLITQKIMSANGINFGTSSFGVDPGILSLSMASGALNPTIIDLDAPDGRIRIQEGASAPVYIIGANVRAANFVFTDLSLGSDRENVKISFTLEYANSDDREFQFSQSLETSVSLRQ